MTGTVHTAASCTCPFPSSYPANMLNIDITPGEHCAVVNDGMRLIEMSPDGKLARVAVDCPDCGNVNRKLRRACGYCGGHGLVEKIVPVEAK